LAGGDRADLGLKKRGDQKKIGVPQEGSDLVKSRGKVPVKDPQKLKYFCSNITNC